MRELTLCVPKTSSTLCDQAIFVDQAADVCVFACTTGRRSTGCVAVSEGAACREQRGRCVRMLHAHGLDAGVAQDGVEGGSEVRSVVADHEHDPVSRISVRRRSV
jgi:hypothetical protein